MKQEKNGQEDSSKNNRCIFSSHNQFILSKAAHLELERIVYLFMSNQI